MGGIMGITGTEESGPTKVRPGVGDIFPAVMAVESITSALHHCERTGEGQYVDVSMVDSMLSLTERIVYQYSYEGEYPARRGVPTCCFSVRPVQRQRRVRRHSSTVGPPMGGLGRAHGSPVLAEEYPAQQDRADHAGEFRLVVNE